MGFRYNFYPRPPRGGRPFADVQVAGRDLFLSTPSARRATVCFRFRCSRSIYFYPRPPRGGRLLSPRRAAAPTGISIHALREEGDRAANSHELQLSNFYPRPPRGGRPNRRVVNDSIHDISIHALREEGDEFVPFYR